MSYGPRETGQDAYKIRKAPRGKRGGSGYVVTPYGEHIIIYGPETMGACQRWIERKAIKAKMTNRRCLCCGRPFESWGIGNRLCVRCKEGGASMEW